MMTETRTGVALSHASDTFMDTDGGGLEAGDARAIHEEDVEGGGEGLDEGEDVGLDLTAHRAEPDVLDVLEQLARESMKQEGEREGEREKGKTKGDDFSLEGLLAESLETIQESAAVKANRKKLKDTRITKAERELIEAKIREWEMAREWTPKAQVAMFYTQYCDCGSHHATFSGIFQRQQHRVSSVQRWVPSTSIVDSGLPKEQKEHQARVTLCGDCAEQQGYGDCTGLNYFSSKHIINGLTN